MLSLGPWEFAWAFLALLWPLPLLLRWLWPARPTPHALPVPGAPVGQLSDAAPATLRMPWWIWIGWTLLILAVMRPQLPGEPIALPAEGRDLMLVVDISGSMSEQDVVWEGRVQSRMDAVKAVAGEFLIGRQGDRVGLVLFGETAHLYTPLSLDTRTAADMLREVEVGLAGQKTAIGDALAVALKHVLDASSAQERVVILLTDGENNAGDVTPDKAAELIAQSRIRLHTIGLAGETRGRGLLGAFRRSGIDQAQLQRLAQIGGGRSFLAEGGQALRSIYAELDRIEPIAIAEEQRLPPIEWYWVLMLGGLLCLLPALWRLP